MTYENSEYWIDLISNFLNDKHHAELTGFIKDSFKDVQNLAAKSKLDSEDFEIFLDARKNRKPDGSNNHEFYISRMDKLFDYLELFDLLDKDKLQSDYVLLIKKLNDKYKASNWIECASDNASSITFATHVAKLTHSKIDSSSLNDSITATKENLVTTSSLAQVIVDGAVAGNQFAPVYQFLSLEHRGVTLAEALAKPSNKILDPFTKSEAQLAKWNEKFSQVTQPSALSTHSLAKQVYFPIDSEIPGDTRYHLLCPLVSSSMAQHIFNSLFNDQMKQVRKQYFEKKYDSSIFYDYPRKAALAVTASNHSNASQLNGKRGGKLYLFNTEPPTWRSQPKPPNYQSSMFNHSTLKNYCRENLEGFMRMFLGVIEIYRKPMIMAGLEKWIQAISDDVLNYASSIRQLPAGWSADSKLEINNLEHCYLLDPDRQDGVFKTAQQDVNWQGVVARDFGSWINKELNNKSKGFTPQVEHRKLWQKLFAEQLRGYMDIYTYDEAKNTTAEHEVSP